MHWLSWEVNYDQIEFLFLPGYLSVCLVNVIMI